VEYRIDRDDMLRRFLAYARIWTTSDEDCEATPSTERQWDLAKLLVEELTALGLEDARVYEHCYVYGSLPERFPAGSPRAGAAPAIGLIAHMDVSQAVSGENVQPIVHESYDGSAIELPGDPSVVLTPEADAPLGDCKGLDIVTADGTTLLGADDKAGIAIILSVLKALRDTPDLTHGPLQVAFTPDEEIGRGANKFDLEAFGAEVAYTIDGEGLGEVEDETFCADSMDFTFHGIIVHPAYAKNKMVNAVKLAADFIASLPKDATSPETTEGREPYVHPRYVEGAEEKTIVKFLIRDFTMEGLPKLEKLLDDKANAVVAAYPGSRVEFETKHWYANMKEILDQRPDAVRLANAAVVAAGLEVVSKPIRGGTDGTRLSFMGLPTPNLFTGGHNFHGKREWIAVQHMQKSAEVCLRLVELWGQRGERQGLLPKVETAL